MSTPAGNKRHLEAGPPSCQQQSARSPALKRKVPFPEMVTFIWAKTHGFSMKKCSTLTPKFKRTGFTKQGKEYRSRSTVERPAFPLEARSKRCSINLET
jgi:hypothetical protein